MNRHNPVVYLKIFFYILSSRIRYFGFHYALKMPQVPTLSCFMEANPKPSYCLLQRCIHFPSFLWGEVILQGSSKELVSMSGVSPLNFFPFWSEKGGGIFLTLLKPPGSLRLKYRVTVYSLTLINILLVFFLPFLLFPFAPLVPPEVRASPK